MVKSCSECAYEAYCSIDLYAGAATCPLRENTDEQAATLELAVGSIRSIFRLSEEDANFALGQGMAAASSIGAILQEQAESLSKNQLVGAAASCVAIMELYGRMIKVLEGIKKDLAGGGDGKD